MDEDTVIGLERVPTIGKGWLDNRSFDILRSNQAVKDQATVISWRPGAFYSGRLVRAHAFRGVFYWFNRQDQVANLWVFRGGRTCRLFGRAASQNKQSTGDSRNSKDAHEYSFFCVGIYTHNKQMELRKGWDRKETIRAAYAALFAIPSLMQA